MRTFKRFKLDQFSGAGDMQKLIVIAVHFGVKGKSLYLLAIKGDYSEVYNTDNISGDILNTQSKTA